MPTESSSRIPELDGLRGLAILLVIFCHHVGNPDHSPLGIMSWISATDQLHTGGLAVVGSVFRDLPEVEWITDRPTWFNEEGMTLGIHDLPHWSRSRFLAGANRYIQQESTFWRRSLWERAGAHMDSSRRNGADFELWVRFFRHAKLYPVDALIGGFRAHGDSLGLTNLDDVHDTHDAYIAADLAATPGLRSVKLFRRLNRFAQSVPKLRGLWNRTALRALYRLPGPDLPPVIQISFRPLDSFLILLLSHF